MTQRLIQLFLIILLLPGMFWASAHAQEAPTWQGQIAYTGPDGNLWLIRGSDRSDNPEPTQLTSDASEQVRYSSPRFSPRGDMLAYCRNSAGGEGGSQLFMMRVGSWQPIPLAEDLYCQSWPQGSFSWSPDGKQIAYTRTFEYSPQADGSQWSKYHGIWAVDIAAASTMELVPPPGKNPLVLPLWSPDGKWIRLYEVVYLEGLGVLRTWERETGALYNLLETGADLFPGFADWSPDAGRLVFDEVAYIGYPGAGLFTAAPAGGDLKTVFEHNTQGAVHPLWSPDGQTLAFLLRTYDRNPQNIIAISSPDGSNLLWIFGSPATLQALDWSPDGKQVLFSSTETTESGEQTGLYIYDLASASHFTAAFPAGKEADWATLPVVDKTVEPGKPVKLPGVRLQGNPVAYLGTNSQLMLYDPANQSQAELSPALAAREFWSSPSGTRLVYADQLVQLQIGADGSVTVRQTTLPAYPSGDRITWAPDENRLAFQDRQGSIWMVDAGGDYVEIPGASSLPLWSSDGRFLGYCTEGERLWAVGGGISLREVASPVNCSGDGAPQWSPGEPLLAYSLRSGVEGSQVNVYDAERGESIALVDAEIIGWSPDGELLGLRSISQAVSGVVTYYASDPRDRKTSELGPVDLEQPGLTGWLQTSEGYILGPYQFNKRLGDIERVAEIFFDYRDPGVLLLGRQGNGLVEVTCQENKDGEPRSLLSANLIGLPQGEEPGLWSWLSPSGEWSAAYAFDPAGYTYLLTRCDRTRQVALENSPEFNPDSFSPGGEWYLQRVSRSTGQVQIMIYNLSTLERQSLDALVGSRAVWVQAPQITAAQGSSISGRVSAEDGSPVGGVAIFVDGEAAAETDEGGAFSLAGLKDGKHRLSAFKEGLEITPEEVTVQVPYEGEDLMFIAVPLEGTQATEPPATPATEAASASEGIAPTGLETGEPVLPPAASAQESQGTLNPGLTSIGMAVGGLLVLALLGVLVLRLRGRKVRIGTTEAAANGGASPAPAEAALPLAASKSGPRAEMDRWLREGVSQVKAGKNREGLQLLRKVVEQQPDNAVAWLWSGMAATRMKDWRSAERCFRQAKKLNHPKADQALKWLEEQRSSW